MDKNTKPRMSSRPPSGRNGVDDFIQAAEYPTPPPEIQQKATLPWDDPLVREDVIKSVNLRLSEPYILKLKYLSEITNKSQQNLIRDILCPEIDRILANQGGI